MSKIKRLSKVAKEFNLGLTTVVEFLKEKGHKVEQDPNAKIDQDMYEALLNEFQSDKKIKEVSKTEVREKVNAQKITIKDQGDKKEAPKESQEEVVIIKNIESPLENLKSDKTTEKAQPKVVGKIEIEDKKAKKEEPKEKEAEKKEEPKEEVEKEEPKEEKTEPEEIKINIQKFDAPKVLRKIELPKEPEKKPKPVASSEDDSFKGKKKKRKRLSKVKVDSKSFTPSDKFKGRKKGKEQKEELTEEEIQKEVKETLARLTASSKSKGSKYRRDKRAAVSEKLQQEAEQAELEKSVLKVTEFVTASELASMMNVSVTEIISACMSLGMMVSINQRLDAETLSVVAEEFGYSVEFISAKEQEDILEEEDESEENLVPRPPIVTIMGHVDHGKTSLLDYIRDANVIAGEAGGITQHIGAYSVEMEDGRKIAFLDTPGHEAFTAMRARGAKVTDVVIIVIAADDNIMPQTKEAISHAQAAEVPIIFAFNKIDKQGANPEKIKEQLANMNLLVEDWGGKYQSQDISAKKGTGVKELLDKVLLEADLLELKANPNKRAVGTVIESSLDKGRGYVATILVQSGTLKTGDVVLAGSYSGRVKAMYNERGQAIKEAGPSTPATLLGLDGAPTAGDKFHVLSDEREARNIADKRKQLMREQGMRTKKHITLDEIGRRIAVGDFQELNIIVKGDVDGSIEALSDSLQKLSTEKIQVNIIHKSVGQISESDVMLATASDAIIIGFQVRPSVTARKMAETEEIDIRLYSIIYDAIDEMRSAMEGMLKAKIEEKIVGTAEIRETFKISKIGTIAGCMVTDGKIVRNNKIRLIREGIVIYTGELGSLKRFKDDAKEVSSGFECGLNVANFNDIKVGDVVESFEQVEVKQTL